jgi:hypothetical protein
MTAAAPIVTEHDGITVVRDDLFPGGTKARYLPQLFDGADEVVYASPAEGGAQFALATIAKALGKRATIFGADRDVPHPRQAQARLLGAKVVLVKPGYLSVVQARAKRYCEATGARLAPFGMDVPGASNQIAEAAWTIDMPYEPHEVWCAGGSGVLARGLQKAWPKATLHVVAVGRPLNIAGAIMHGFPRPFAWAHTGDGVPFPADRHYECKAWQMCRQLGNAKFRRTLFWNVTGPASDSAA